ncbi:MAG TPA: copper-binding protein [Accumulibacter sp.]|jgi:Cu/Ag efflux protein CusF|nr:copper-binding protein [Accumulibacter sp.]HQC80062.1 copper-binding protein [Accumulibacter sp.]
MTIRQQLLFIATLVLSVGAPIGGIAQNTGIGDKREPTPLTDGDVRKVDRDAGKLTIKHGDIKNLGMPGMTMAFAVKDKKLLDKVKTGDKIRFVVVDEGGKWVITDIQPAR